MKQYLLNQNSKSLKLLLRHVRSSWSCVSSTRSKSQKLGQCVWSLCLKQNIVQNKIKAVLLCFGWAWGTCDYTSNQPCLPPLRPRFISGLEVVCGLSFSRSQSDSEGFPPSSKSTPSLFHQAVVLCSEVIGSCSGAERLAGSTAPSVRPRWAAPLAIQSLTARKGDLQVRE